MEANQRIEKGKSKFDENNKNNQARELIGKFLFWHMRLRKKCRLMKPSAKLFFSAYLLQFNYT